MAKEHGRRIGEEILEGIREIKRGEVGRVVVYPPVAEASHLMKPSDRWRR